jgi:hypothetical protein
MGGGGWEGLVGGERMWDVGWGGGACGASTRFQSMETMRRCVNSNTLS